MSVWGSERTLVTDPKSVILGSKRSFTKVSAVRVFKDFFIIYKFVKSILAGCLQGVGLAFNADFEII